MYRCYIYWCINVNSGWQQEIPHLHSTLGPNFQWCLCDQIIEHRNWRRRLGLWLTDCEQPVEQRSRGSSSPSLLSTPCFNKSFSFSLFLCLFLLFSASAISLWVESMLTARSSGWDFGLLEFIIFDKENRDDWYIETLNWDVPKVQIWLSLKTMKDQANESSLFNQL